MGQQDVRESSTFWFTLIEFEPEYQVCCVAAENQGDDRMVGQRFREALTAEKGRLLAEPNSFVWSAPGRRGIAQHEQAPRLNGRASRQYCHR